MYLLVRRSVRAFAMLALFGASSAVAQKAYGPGVSDTEITLGQSTPLSGPASAFGAGAGREVLAFIQMLNENGGINGRKINFTQLDNAYNAPKAIEQSRKLVEEIGVLAEVGTIGTVPNVAIQKYLNANKVPQLFITAGGRRFNDPETYPWTVPLYPDFQTEGEVVAKYLLKTKPDAKIGVLYQNDDYGKDYLNGLRKGLGAKVAQVVMEASYELADPTIDSQIIKLKAAGIDTLIEQSSSKAAAQSIRKVHELGWSPLHIIGGSTASVETVLKPAGLDASKGLVTTQFLKQPGDPAWANDIEMKAYKEFLAKYAPAVHADDYSVLVAYMNLNALVLVLQKCGDDLTRQNLIKQATSIRGAHLPLLLPGVSVSTTSTDYAPFKTLRIAIFNGENWTIAGDPISVD
ncbi:MAG: ABC transporter substrate-binding protein [Hyphomicrobiales bacterium]|nr:ABC transporter substrate-binding protein [Hyphomicrobiales bacterium]